MKKIALKLEDLSVASFETSRTPAERGTVNANGNTQRGNTCADTCGATICPDSCQISCVPSCLESCDPAMCPVGTEMSLCIC